MEVWYDEEAAPLGGAVVVSEEETHRVKLHKRTQRGIETLRFAQGDGSDTPRGRLHKRTHRRNADDLEKCKNKPIIMSKYAGFSMGRWRSRHPRLLVTMLVSQTSQASRRPASPTEKCGRGSMQKSEKTNPM